MKDFIFHEVRGLRRETARFLLFRFLIFFGIILGFVLINGTGAGLGYGVGHIADSAPAGGFWAGLVGLVLALGIMYSLRERLLYRVKAGHIAVLVEVREGRAIPGGKGQIAYGIEQVLQRFATFRPLMAYRRCGPLASLRRLDTLLKLSSIFIYVGTTAVILASPLSVVGAAESRSGIDCGCSATGVYQEPGRPRGAQSGKPPYVHLVTVTEGESAASKPKYKLTASSSSAGITLTIRHASNNAQVFQVMNLPSSAGWGFSPDEHRFVYHFVDGSNRHQVRLHNLEGSQPNTPVWSPSANAAFGTVVLFSPRGKYLLFGALTATNTFRLQVADTKTGAQNDTGLQLNHEFSFVSAPEIRHDAEDEEGKEKDGDPKFFGVTWGFSPGREGSPFADDSFAYAWASSATVVQRRVVNLPSKNLVHQDSVSGSALSLLFSPEGRYLLFASLSGNNNVLLDIRDAATGNQVYRDNFAFTVSAAGGRRFGVSAWGFSPDNQDATFLYAWVTGQDQVQWKLVNLQAAKEVHSESLSGTASWRFSRCGDVLGVVSQAGAIKSNRLLQTRDGFRIDKRLAGAPEEFRSTNSWHVGLFGTINHELAANIAGRGCTPPDTTPPTWPSGSKLVFSNITTNEITVSWPEAEDDNDVTGYRLSRNQQVVATYGADTRSHEFTNLFQGTSYSFRVEARDAAGNWSAALTGTASTKMPPPEWPESASLTVRACTGERLYFDWTPAEGQVAGYRLFRIGTQGEQDELLDEVDGDTLSHTVMGVALELDRWHNFRVEAGNSTNDWSEDGPKHQWEIWLTHAPGPCWPANAAATTHNVGARSVTVRWPEAMEANEVVRYELFRAYTFMQSLDPRVTSPADGLFVLPIDGLWWDTEYVFSVVAIDAAGNLSEFLISEPVRTADRTKTDPPTWPPGSALAAEAGTSRVTLSWSAAQDDAGVHGYRIFLGETRIASVSGTTLTHEITGLTPSREYLFHVQAGDAWENWSTDGPSRTVITMDGTPEPEVETLGAQEIIEFYVGPTDWWEGDKLLAEPAVSGNGRHVLFVSSAPDLLSGLDTHGVSQIYLYDRETGALELVSVSSAGRPGDGISRSPSITPDGRYVAFYSSATNLDWRVSALSFPGAAYVRDRLTGETAMVSFDQFGRPVRSFQGVLHGPTISDDGRFVVFGSGGVWVYDRLRGRSNPAHYTPAGISLGTYIDRPVISGDGRFVAFRSGKIYVHDRWSGRMIVVAEEPQRTRWQPIAFSGDGSVVVYEQEAIPAGSGGENGLFAGENDLFAHDLGSGHTEWISRAHTTVQSMVESTPPPAVSADGRYIAFITYGSAMDTRVPCANPTAEHVVVHDRWERTSEIITGYRSELEPTGRGRFPVISGDGQVVAYQTLAGSDWESVKVYAYQRGNTDIRPPCWPHRWWVEPHLWITDLRADTVTLEWAEATDDFRVTGYRLYMDGLLVTEFAANGRSHTITDLAPDTEYAFRVEAGDAAGHWTAGQPEVRVTTLSGEGDADPPPPVPDPEPPVPDPEPPVPDPERPVIDDGVVFCAIGCEEELSDAGARMVVFEYQDSDTGMQVRLEALLPDVIGDLLRHRVYRTLLDGTETLTEAVSDVPGSTVTLELDEQGRPRIVTRAGLGDGVLLEVLARADGSAEHRVSTEAGDTVAGTDLPGAFTRFTDEGEVVTFLEFASGQDRFRAAAWTEPDGRGRTGFERWEDMAGEWVLESRTIDDTVSRFEAGHRVWIESVDGGGLRFEIETQVARDLYF